MASVRVGCRKALYWVVVSALLSEWGVDEVSFERSLEASLWWNALNDRRVC